MGGIATRGGACVGRALDGRRRSFGAEEGDGPATVAGPVHSVIRTSALELGDGLTGGGAEDGAVCGCHGP